MSIAHFFADKFNYTLHTLLELNNIKFLLRISWRQVFSTCIYTRILQGAEPSPAVKPPWGTRSLARHEPILYTGMSSPLCLYVWNAGNKYRKQGALKMLHDNEFKPVHTTVGTHISKKKRTFVQIGYSCMEIS